MNEYIIIPIIVGAGALGGVASFIIARRNNEPVQYKMLEAIFLGIIAAATVPLFLNIASSGLLADDRPQAAYILAGFCILAGLSAVRFLRSLSDQALQLAKEARDTAQAAHQAAQSNQDLLDTVIDAHADQPVAPPAASGADSTGALESFNPASTRSTELPPEERLHQALLNPASRFHTVEGLAHDCDIPVEQVSKIISDMEAKGAVKKIANSKGKPYWILNK